MDGHLCQLDSIAPLQAQIGQACIAPLQAHIRQACIAQRRVQKNCCIVSWLVPEASDVRDPYRRSPPPIWSGSANVPPTPFTSRNVETIHISTSNKNTDPLASPFSFRAPFSLPSNPLLVDMALITQCRLVAKTPTQRISFLFLPLPCSDLPPRTLLYSLARLPPMIPL